MRLNFRDADFDSLAALWNTAAPPPFKVTAARLRTHLIGCPLFDWGASTIQSDGSEPSAFVAVKRSAAKLYAGPDPDAAHIAAFVCSDCAQGVDLLAQAKDLLHQRGIYRLFFGQDSLHFFPGCPDDWTMLRDFLLIEGFNEDGECADVVHDLASYEPPCELSDTVRPFTAETVPMLREFLSREFPARWAYDTMMKIEAEERADFVYGLFQNGRCEGFAVTQDSTHRLPLGGAVFPESLGSDWCALGPIGVSKAIRGQGWGDKMLAGALSDLKGKGKRKCRIDWTGLLEWYGRHGFRPERRYKTMSLRLDDAPGR